MQKLIFIVEFCMYGEFLCWSKYDFILKRKCWVVDFGDYNIKIIGECDIYFSSSYFKRTNYIFTLIYKKSGISEKGKENSFEIRLLVLRYLIFIISCKKTK